MTMTRQHFQLIADVLSDAPDVMTHDQVVAAFAAILSHTNPRFDRAKFVRAAERNDDREER